MRLREAVSWMLGMREFTDQFVPDANAVRRMALQDVVNRQENASRAEPPDDFGPLAGFIRRQGGPVGVGEPILAKYSEDEEDWDDSQDVVIEPRGYYRSVEDTTQLETTEIQEMKTASRKLAWLLHSSRFSAGIAPSASSGPLLPSLNCLGYLDNPGESEIVFVYELPNGDIKPSSPSITTLYSIINEKDTASTSLIRKPSLGNRFFVAHALALTVLNIHSSSWVHKNIWSKGVLLFLYPNVEQPLRSKRLVPYLTGWGLARLQDGNTVQQANFDVVPNLYRHPRRQGQFTASFKSEHDVYGLGVVLIEIGLWRTVDQILSNDIAKGRVAPGRLLKWWRSTGCEEIKGEMGKAFSGVVDRCLQGKKVRPITIEEKQTELVELRDCVVDVLAMGVDL
jgi:hypothetical protein